MQALIKKRRTCVQSCIYQMPRTIMFSVFFYLFCLENLWSMESLKFPWKMKLNWNSEIFWKMKLNWNSEIFLKNEIELKFWDFSEKWNWIEILRFSWKMKLNWNSEIFLKNEIKLKFWDFSEKEKYNGKSRIFL